MMKFETLFVLNNYMAFAVASVHARVQRDTWQVVTSSITAVKSENLVEMKIHLVIRDSTTIEK